MHKCADQPGSEAPAQLLGICQELIDTAQPRIIFVQPPTVLVALARHISLYESDRIAAAEDGDMMQVLAPVIGSGTTPFVDLIH
jgi:hypothetical protein